MKTVVYVATSPVTFDTLMKGHFSYMRRQGLRVIAVAAPGPELDSVAEREGIEVKPVAMERQVNLVADLVALARLVRFLRSVRPDIVNAGTPKAGMLGMVASWIAGVPVRIYTVRGLRGETLSGVRGLIMSCTERLASACSTEVVCVSRSLRQLYVKRGYATRQKSFVLGDGSSNGVDLGRFEFRAGDRVRIRQQLGIPATAPVVGFVGRFVRDKGISELVRAFDVLRLSMPDATLLLVGDYEDGDPVDPATRARIRSGQGIVLGGHVADTAPFYSAFDVLAFASHREGFPNAPLEAAAVGVPCVGFDATGTRDAVVDGRTGSLVSIGQIAHLAVGLERYLSDADLRRAHGQAASERAAGQFDRTYVWSLLAGRYFASSDQLRSEARGFGGHVA